MKMIDRHYGHFATDSRSHALALLNGALEEGGRVFTSGRIGEDSRKKRKPGSLPGFLSRGERGSVRAFPLRGDGPDRSDLLVE